MKLQSHFARNWITEGGLPLPLSHWLQSDLWADVMCIFFASFSRNMSHHFHAICRVIMRRAVCGIHRASFHAMCCVIFCDVICRIIVTSYVASLFAEPSVESIEPAVFTSPYEKAYVTINTLRDARLFHYSGATQVCSGRVPGDVR
jgi:hypothetical protein